MQIHRKRRGLFLSVLILCILVGYLALGVGTSPYPVEDFSKDTAYPVLKVVDGDTVKIDYEGKETTVRLIGIDTPETVHPSNPVEAFGKEASNFTKNLLNNSTIVFYTLPIRQGDRETRRQGEKDFLPLIASLSRSLLFSQKGTANVPRIATSRIESERNFRGTI